MRSVDEHLGCTQRLQEQLRQVQSSGVATGSSTGTRNREQSPIQIQQLLSDLDQYGRWAARNTDQLERAFGEGQQQTIGSAR